MYTVSMFRYVCSSCSTDSVSLSFSLCLPLSVYLSLSLTPSLCHSLLIYVCLPLPLAVVLEIADVVNRLSTAPDSNIDVGGGQLGRHIICNWILNMIFGHTHTHTQIPRHHQQAILDGQADRQTDGRMDRQTSRQTEAAGKADRTTEREVPIKLFIPCSVLAEPSPLETSGACCVGNDLIL